MTTNRALSRRSMRLPLPLLLALRTLRSSRRDAYVSFLSLLAGGGIALGVAALILVLAGLSGLQSFLREDILARTPHAVVELPSGVDVEAARTRLLELPEIVDVRRLLSDRGWLVIDGSSIDVEVVGFEGELPAFFPRTDAQRQRSAELAPPLDLREEAAGGAETPAGLYLGDHLATRFALEPGMVVEIVSPRPTLTPFGPQPRLVSVRVAGIFSAGRVDERGQRVAMPLAAATRLFGERRPRLELTATSLGDALDLAPAARRTLAELTGDGEEATLRTWRDLNRGLFFALELEKRLMFVALFLIVPVAAMALVTVLALLISSKRGEIGMLHAMGATPADVERTFFVLGTTLACVGLGIGTVTGVVAARLLDRYRLISPPGDVYVLDHVPFLVRPADLAAVLGATALFTLASTIYASRKAAALDPTAALRTA